MTEQQTIYNNLYNALITLHDDETLTLTQERHDEIPVILAFIAIHMNDTDKVREVADKFGPETFTTPITPWGATILQTVNINLRGPSSPTNIQDINAEIIH